MFKKMAKKGADDKKYDEWIITIQNRKTHDHNGNSSPKRQIKNIKSFKEIIYQQKKVQH